MRTKAEIAEELRRLGVEVPSSPAPIISRTAESPSTPISPVRTKAQIAAELKELGVENPAAAIQSPPGGFLHRLGQVGRGALSSLGAKAQLGPLGGNMNAPYEDWELEVMPRMQSANAIEELPELAGLGQQYEPAENDKWGRVAKTSGEILMPDNPLLSGYGYITKAANKGAKALLKALGKETALAGTLATATEATPRLTKPGTVPGLAEDIGKGVIASGAVAGLSGIPGALKRRAERPKLNVNEKAVADYLAKSVGEKNVPKIIKNIEEYESKMGYRPTTAEVADSADLAKIHRAQQGVVGSQIAEHQGRGVNTIIDELDKAALSPQEMQEVQQHVAQRLKQYESGVKEQLKAIEPQIETPEAGRTIQKGLHEVLKEKKKTRFNETNPLYKEVEAMEQELNPKHVKKYIKKSKEKGKIRRDIDYVKRMLRPEAEATPEESAYNKYYTKASKEAKEAGPKVYEKFLEQTELPKNVHPTVVELTKTREAINELIQEQHNKGNSKRVLKLKELRAELDKDLQNISVYKEATAKYRELSQPVSEITKQPTLNKVTKRINKEFTLGESEVVEQFINNSAGSIDDSKALIRQIKDKPEVIKAIKHHLNYIASKEIVDPETGLVNINKLNAFKQKYPGAQILYPELYKGKLGNIKNAQIMVNQYTKKMKKVADTLAKDELGEYVGKDTKNIISDIFNKNSKDNMKTLVSELRKDGATDAIKGLQNETINHFKESIMNAGAEGKHNKLSYDKTKKFLKRHRGALEEVLEPSQMGVIDEIAKITEGQNKALTLGVAPGSPTSANIRNALDMSKQTGFGMAGLKAKALKLGAGTPFVGKFIEYIIELRLQKNEEILNHALVNPHYASMLMRHPLASKQELESFVKSFKPNANTRYISPLTLKLLRENQKEENK